MAALGIDHGTSIQCQLVAVCHVGLFWLALAYGQLIRGINVSLA